MPSGRLVEATTRSDGKARSPSSSSQIPMMSGAAASRARSGGRMCSNESASASSK